MLGAYRLLDAANMVGFLTASFLLPFIVRQRENKNEINQVILASRHLLIIFSLATAVVFFFWAPRIQQVLYHNTDVTAINVLQWCLPALIGYSLVQVYGTVLTATGHIVPFCYITLVAVLLNAGLNIWLIPVWGARELYSHWQARVLRDRRWSTHKKMRRANSLPPGTNVYFYRAALFGFSLLVGAAG
jgi:O-antigen/teichoic acid export membrane protein